MAEVVFYGASDDLIEVEGSVSGCGEYSSEDQHFTVVGSEGKLRVRVWYTQRGVWAIAVAPLDEDVPMLQVVIDAAEWGYSAQATIQDVELVVAEAPKEDGS